jgi:hypothetical protein
MKYAMPFIALSLAACGGGSTSYVNYTEIDRSFSDGSGVATASNVPYIGNKKFNAALLVTDTKAADKILDANLLANNGMLILVDQTKSGPYYQQRQEGLNSEGNPVILIVDGINLSSGGYVSGSIIAIEGDEVTGALATDGSAATSLPIGIFSYSGKASIGGNTTFNGVELEDGTFTMRADFVNKSANITAQTPNKFFSSNNLSIDASSGKFEGNGSIGVISVESTPAAVVGYFAGSQAEGVHGIAYQISDVYDGMGAVFYGSR